MKKSVFLLALAIFYVSIGFAKTPEIINPPRPHAKFKILLIVEHTLYPGHTHYLYTDKYHIFQETDGWMWILPEGRYEIYSADRGEPPRSDSIASMVFHCILLSYPEISSRTIFLKSNAPKPIAVRGVNTIPLNDSKKVMKFWTARAKKFEVNPKKAKIAFKP